MFGKCRSFEDEYEHCLRSCFEHFNHTVVSTRRCCRTKQNGASEYIRNRILGQLPSDELLRSVFWDADALVSGVPRRQSNRTMSTDYWRVEREDVRERVVPIPKTGAMFTGFWYIYAQSPVTAITPKKKTLQYNNVPPLELSLIWCMILTNTVAVRWGQASSVKDVCVDVDVN